MWLEFKAMGTDVVIVAIIEEQQSDILIHAKQRIIEFEQRFSRFLADSELVKFNNSPENNLELSREMIKLLAEAKYYYKQTNGIFDPGIIDSLETVGYDKSFENITEDGAGFDVKSLAEKLKTRPKISELKIEKGHVQRPKGLRLDFGGIGKGYIVDAVSRDLFAGVNSYWISAGGDIIISGYQDDGHSWKIGVQNPLQPNESIFNINNDGEKIGIATSGIIKRHGKNGEFLWNHIIDPRTGLPIDNNILSVTAISSSAVKADILAKTVLILGEEAGLDFIEKEADSACVIFNLDNKPIFSRRAYNYFEKI